MSVIRWSAAEVAATAEMNRALRAAGVSRKEWDAMGEADRLTLLGHGDEVMRVCVGEGCPTVVVTADGRELVAPAPSCGCDDGPSNADLRRVIERKRIRVEHRRYREREDALTAALAASGAKRTPVAVCHCGWVHLSLGGGCTRPTRESLIACGFTPED